MKKMISLSFFAFTPAYCSVDKAMTSKPVVDGPAVEVACKGSNVFINTDLVAAR